MNMTAPFFQFLSLPDGRPPDPVISDDRPPGCPRRATFAAIDIALGGGRRLTAMFAVFSFCEARVDCAKAWPGMCVTRQEYGLRGYLARAAGPWSIHGVFAVFRQILPDRPATPAKATAK